MRRSKLVWAAGRSRREPPSGINESSCQTSFETLGCILYIRTDINTHVLENNYRRIANLYNLLYSSAYTPNNNRDCFVYNLNFKTRIHLKLSPTSPWIALQCETEYTWDFIETNYRVLDRTLAVFTMSLQ